MDNIDGMLLNEIQFGIEINNRPFKNIASKLNISEDDVVLRLNKLKENGYIRRFGGMFNSDKLGFESTLVAMKVENDIENIAKIVNEYDGVTHNYQRDDSYNIWFTLIASTQEEIENILNEIKEKTKVKKILNLKSINKHKVHVYLNF